jgi:hypothetical protein
MVQYVTKYVGEIYSNLCVHCAGDKLEKNKMGGACSAYRGGERGIEGFGVET